MTLLVRGVGAALILAATATSGVQGQDLNNFEAQGNLAPNMPISCVALEAVPRGSNPVDIYLGVLSCVAEGKFIAARELMLLGDIGGKFDRGRVTDESAHAAPVVVKQAVQAQFDPAERQQLEASFRELGDTALRCALGQRIAARGAPDYRPTYMIQHGMSTFVGGSAPAVKEYENPEQAYRMLVGDYLDCSVAGS